MTEKAATDGPTSIPTMRAQLIENMADMGMPRELAERLGAEARLEAAEDGTDDVLLRAVFPIRAIRAPRRIPKTYRDVEASEIVSDLIEDVLRVPLTVEERDTLVKYAGSADMDKLLLGDEIVVMRRAMSKYFGLGLPETETLDEHLERLTRDGFTASMEYFHGAVEGLNYKVLLGIDRLQQADDIRGVSMQGTWEAAMLCAEAQMRLLDQVLEPITGESFPDELEGDPTEIDDDNDDGSEAED